MADIHKIDDRYRMKTVHEVVAYLDTAIAQFKRDPADSDHQEGYLEALKETLRVIVGDHARAA